MIDEVTFVFVGGKLPRYASASLQLAVQTSGLNVRLVGSQALRRAVPKNIGFTALEDFYKPDMFSSASKRVLFSHQAGNGFWLKTLERLFVLGQFQSYSQQRSFLHAELDQLLFRVDELVSHIESLEITGFFVPRHNNERAVGSIAYCNDVEKFRSLLDFASTAEPFNNEMVLMATWLSKFPHYAHPLPTIYDAMRVRGNDDRIHLFGGIADAAQLGQWAAGIDPRNVKLTRRPENKFVDPPAAMLLTREELESLSFFRNDDGNLVVSGRRDFNHKLYNLHIHSKIHRFLVRSPSAMDDFLASVNLHAPVVFPGARRTQVAHRVRKGIRQFFSNPVKAFIRPINTFRMFAQHPQTFVAASVTRLNAYLGRRPTSAPFVSGDTFRAAAHHVLEAGRHSVSGEVSRGDLLFCESEKASGQLLEEFRRLGEPVVLLLGNSDKNHGQNLGSVRDSLHPESIVFAQNLVQRVDGVEVLPIGLENAWRNKHGVVRNFKKMRDRSVKKVPRVMWGFNVGTNRELRQVASQELLKAPVADHFGQMSPKLHRETLARYAFVASPPGNGLDTHRTWEAMYLRCVPVVLRSAMAMEYEKIGLPVWVIDSYEELTKLTEVDLALSYAAFKPRFDSPALWSEYWMSRIDLVRRDMMADQ